MAGITPEEYCENTIEAEIYMDRDALEYFGKLRTDEWRETIDGKKVRVSIYA